MKRIITVFLAAVIAFGLSACGCKHERWIEASCTSPAVCAQCGKTQGKPAEHQWTAATCIRPRHCAVCNLTEGELGDHVWKEVFPSLNICTECGLIDGRAVAFELQPNQYVGIDGHYRFAVTDCGADAAIGSEDAVYASAETGSSLIWLSFDFANLSEEDRELVRIFSDPTLVCGDSSFKGQFAMSGGFDISSNEKRSFYMYFSVPELLPESGDAIEVFFSDSGLDYSFSVTFPEPEAEEG